MIKGFLNRCMAAPSCMQLSKEDKQTDIAVFHAERILAIHKVAKGTPHQVGPFTITSANTTGGGSILDDTEIEIDYHGRRVLNYSAYSDEHSAVVSRRQSCPDFGWTAELAAEFQKALRIQTAEANKAGYYAD